MIYPVKDCPASCFRRRNVLYPVLRPAYACIRRARAAGQRASQRVSSTRRRKACRCLTTRWFRASRGCR
eukprot:1471604-Rhodomonas_salina.3